MGILGSFLKGDNRYVCIYYVCLIFLPVYSIMPCLLVLFGSLVLDSFNSKSGIS